MLKINRNNRRQCTTDAVYTCGRLVLIPRAMLHSLLLCSLVQPFLQTCSADSYRFTFITDTQIAKAVIVGCLLLATADGEIAVE